MGYEQERARSEARQGNRKRKRRAKPVAIIILIAVVVAIVVGVLVLVFVGKEALGDLRDQREQDAAAAAQAALDLEAMLSQEEGDTEDVDPLDGKPYYYDITREDRYEAFSAEHPDIAIDDVYWMVNCDLDNPPYEDSQPVQDPNELLILVNKYYHLPPDFVPADMVSVGNTMMRPDAAEAMNAMIGAAKEAGHTLWSQSGFRSYDVQTRLYTDYSARDGVEAADTYSARPGHSEHQTGLATDLNTITDAFGNTPEGKWAAEHCWEYGFIVRYTADNIGITHYKSEPWHMRYIGHEAAMIMHDEQIESFEEYWVKYVMYSPY